MVQLAAVDERSRSGDVVHFETGEPVTFEYTRNTEPTPYLGSRYQQDIEPHGRYMLHATPGVGALPGWTQGRISFRNPLVLAFNTDPDAQTLYNETSWKAQLHDRYGAGGKELSRALADDGYDGIITVELGTDDRDWYTKEIVDLTWFHGPDHPAQLRERLMPPD